MAYSVVYTPEAREQLRALYRYIAKKEAWPAIAQRLTDAIVHHCERFREFPFPRLATQRVTFLSALPLG
jgi:plasmid stabilization system protein ParE